MASKQEIEIVIAADGSIKLDVKGFKGPGCLTHVKKIADAVGEITATDIKPEYYEQAQAQAQAKTKKQP